MRITRPCRVTVKTEACFKCTITQLLVHKPVQRTQRLISIPGKLQCNELLTTAAHDQVQQTTPQSTTTRKSHVQPQVETFHENTASLDWFQSKLIPSDQLPVYALAFSAPGGTNSNTPGSNSSSGVTSKDKPSAESSEPDLQGVEVKNGNQDKKDDNGDGEEDDSLPVRLALGALAFYRGVLSPLMQPSCRYIPTCSQYSIESYKKFGVVRGSVLTAWRLMRCSPFGSSGYDPPIWPPPGLAVLYGEGTWEYGPHVTCVLGAWLLTWIGHGLWVEVADILML